MSTPEAFFGVPILPWVQSQPVECATLFLGYPVCPMMAAWRNKAKVIPILISIPSMVHVN